MISGVMIVIYNQVGQSEHLKSHPLNNNYFQVPLKLLYYVPMTDVGLTIRPVTTRADLR